LIKATKNNLYHHSFVYNNKCTSWKYIEEFYESDKKTQFRAAPKFTDAHIRPNNFQKMKVKLATQVLSRSVAAGTDYIRFII